MIFLSTVTHDLSANTLEATWLEEVFDVNNVLTGYKRAKCRNYSSSQKAEFLADCVPLGQKYSDLAGW